ncbi:MAG: hypothetical protein ACXVPQ_04725, partial [Bacteroidia bacterium]
MPEPHAYSPRRQGLLFFMAGLLLYACKPSAKLSSTAGDKSPDAKTQLIIDNLYIEGCKERM